jgi:predicted protein tyrosine phosphatase
VSWNHIFVAIGVTNIIGPSGTIKYTQEEKFILRNHIMNERYQHLRAKRNQLSNVKNPYQGNYKKVLFVCSAGLLRSATAAHTFSAEPYNWNTRTAGIGIEYALNPVTEALLEWADKVYCMEKEHLDDMKHIFGNIVDDLLESRGEDFIQTLSIPDTFPYRHPELVDALKKAIDIPQS